MYRPTMESSTSSQPYQPYSPINPTNLDMNFEDLMFSQKYNYSQDYSMSHGSGHGSAHGSVSFYDNEDDSQVEEVSPVKPKNPSRRAAKTKKDETKEVNEPPKEWTVEEEIALCQGTLKKKLVQQEVMTRSLANRKTGFALKLVFFAPSPKILKRITKVGRKKSKTSETISGSASGAINLNEKADEAVQETQEFRPMSRDRAKAKKKAVGSASSIVDLVADKFYNMKQKKKNKEQQAYMEMKNRELNIREAEAREIAQLKREKLEIQRRTLELAEKDKRDRDILFYNSIIDTNLPPIQQQKLLEMKIEINERYNLDYWFKLSENLCLILVSYFYVFLIIMYCFFWFIM
nr:hypothetical protein [Tanacetum cinerariifolium]